MWLFSFTQLHLIALTEISTADAAEMETSTPCADDERAECDKKEWTGSNEDDIMLNLYNNNFFAVIIITLSNS